MLHHRRVPQQVHSPVNLVISIGIGDRSQSMDSQLGSFGEIKCVGNEVLVSLTAIRRNLEGGDLITDIAYRRGSADRAAAQSRSGQRPGSREAGSCCCADQGAIKKKPSVHVQSLGLERASSTVELRRL